MFKPEQWSDLEAIINQQTTRAFQRILISRVVSAPVEEVLEAVSSRDSTYFTEVREQKRQTLRALGKDVENTIRSFLDARSKVLFAMASRLNYQSYLKSRLAAMGIKFDATLQALDTMQLKNFHQVVKFLYQRGKRNWYQEEGAWVLPFLSNQPRSE